MSATDQTRRMSWILSLGFITLATLCLPDATLVEISEHLPQPLQDPATLTLLVLVPGAVVSAALLLYLGLRLGKEGQVAVGSESRISAAPRENAKRVSVVALVLSASVLAKLLHTFYSFMVWDTTGDSLGNFWLVLPLLAVLFSGMLLLGLAGKSVLAGFSYLLLIPALVLVATRAQGVNARQLTEARAESIKQAIDAYNTQQGHYPQDLQQLVPGYAISFPGPVVILGQNWCYEGGNDYYRLGYLDRQHWSSPILFGRLYSSAGHAPVREDVCREAIDTYRARHPDWDGVLQAYGKPTPTPDVGE